MILNDNNVDPIYFALVWIPEQTQRKEDFERRFCFVLRYFKVKYFFIYVICTQDNFYLLSLKS